MTEKDFFPNRRREKTQRKEGQKNIEFIPPGKPFNPVRSFTYFSFGRSTVKYIVFWPTKEFDIARHGRSGEIQWIYWSVAANSSLKFTYQFFFFLFLFYSFLFLFLLCGGRFVRLCESFEKKNGMDGWKWTKKYGVWVFA